MGREIKRVALDFQWPLDQIWEGFIRPDSLQGKKCEECDGSGQTHAGWWLQHFSQRISMLAGDIGAQEQGRPLHPWLANDTYPHTRWTETGYEVVRPSEDIADLLAALAGDSDTGRVKSSFGSSYTVYRALVKAAGIENWGVCTPCEGTGRIEEYEGQFKERDEWKENEPPAGEGWQVWETVSDGSPISPVFATRDDLIDWLTSSRYTRGGPLTKAQAEGFVGNGWAPSFVVANGELKSGDKAFEQE